jgi:hypothetical protein
VPEKYRALFPVDILPLLGEPHTCEACLLHSIVLHSAFRVCSSDFQFGYGCMYRIRSYLVDCPVQDDPDCQQVQVQRVHY